VFDQSKQLSLYHSFKLQHRLRDSLGAVPTTVNVRRAFTVSLVIEFRSECGMSLTVCIMAGNDIKWINGCLESASQVADEIVVADTGSNDGTAESAMTYGAKVVPAPPISSGYATCINTALEAASCEWILRLDTDERLEPTTIPSLKNFTKSSDATAGLIQIHDYRGASRWHFWSKMVLFRNLSNIRFANPIHESIWRSVAAMNGRVENVPVIFNHLDYLRDVPAVLAKRRRYETALKEAIKSRGESNRPVYLAEISMLDGDMSTAEVMLSDFNSRKPDWIDGHLVLASLYYSTARYEEACDEFLNVLSIAAKAPVKQIEDMQKVKQWHEASSVVVEGLNGLGMCFAQMQEHSKALEHFRLAGTFGQHLTHVHFNMAIVERTCGNGEAYRRHVNEAASTCSFLTNPLFDEEVWHHPIVSVLPGLTSAEIRKQLSHIEGSTSPKLIDNGSGKHDVL
jgi:glycosyltransferase involved in cell wall biosynthesis